MRRGESRGRRSRRLWPPRRGLEEWRRRRGAAPHRGGARGAALWESPLRTVRPRGGRGCAEREPGQVPRGGGTEPAPLRQGAAVVGKWTGWLRYAWSAVAHELVHVGNVAALPAARDVRERGTPCRHMQPRCRGAVLEHLVVRAGGGPLPRTSAASQGRHLARPTPALLQQNLRPGAAPLPHPGARTPTTFEHGGLPC